MLLIYSAAIVLCKVGTSYYKLADDKKKTLGVYHLKDIQLSP